MSELVTIARFRDLPQAELARGKLESEGIAAYLADRYLIGVNWNFSFAVGGVRLQVASEDAAEARVILSADESSAAAESAAARAGFDWEDSCPSCGSKQLKQIKLGRKSAAISMLLGMPILFWGTRLSCRNCGHTWRPARRREPFPDIPAAVDDEDAETPAIGEKNWRDDVPWAIFILMCLVAGYMLYEYTK